MDDPKTLVSTDWLAAHLRDPDLRVIDGSWFLPQMSRDAKADYDRAHIPGARFFDIDEISDNRSELPHMAAPVEKFISRMRAMGIGDGHQIVVYDQMGVFSAPRVWWNFRLMGKTDIAVLDGGLPKWIAEGREIEDLPPLPRERHITVQRQAHLVKDVTQVAHASKLGDHEIIDARAHGRFIGAEEEPRPNLRKGHIPGAKNVPWMTLVNGDNTMKSPEELRAIFTAAGVDLSKPAITTCGSGVNACMLALALERAGQDNWAVYDGAWAEWGMFNDLRIATGEA
ncbi:MAG: 3-mercaptopyruvate sulfurtransferase [Paracoccaceae bacterium]|jgi:thiosulfate/3-mercaptopyruvate sulfurtransferase